MLLRCVLVPTAPGIDATRRLGRRLHAHADIIIVAPGPEPVLAGMASLMPMDCAPIEAIEQAVGESAAEGQAALRA